jgi:hypothetical protein
MKPGDRIFYMLPASQSATRPEIRYLAATLINIGPSGRYVIKTDNYPAQRIVKPSSCCLQTPDGKLP